jgi:toxin-antitoxin system PIN domain toxin
MTVLLDGNLLVALTVADHVHHEPARRWFGKVGGAFATNPITQGTLLRLLIRNGLDAGAALAVLRGVTGHARHQFWPADRSFDPEALRGVIAHRQVTDGYLAAQARDRAGRLATFDRGLAVTHPDVVDVIKP